jgi:hypothetical protein
MIPKLGSKARFGAVPRGEPAALKTPSGTRIVVGIGPPPPWVIEYIFQSPLIDAEICAVSLPPAFAFVGFTLIESVTGFCPGVGLANNSVTAIRNMGPTRPWSNFIFERLC